MKDFLQRYKKHLIVGISVFGILCILLGLFLIFSEKSSYNSFLATSSQDSLKESEIITGKVEKLSTVSKSKEFSVLKIVSWHLLETTPISLLGVITPKHRFDIRNQLIDAWLDTKKTIYKVYKTLLVFKPGEIVLDFNGVNKILGTGYKVLSGTDNRILINWPKAKLFLVTDKRISFVHNKLLYSNRQSKKSASKKSNMKYLYEIDIVKIPNLVIKTKLKNILLEEIKVPFDKFLHTESKIPFLTKSIDLKLISPFLKDLTGEILFSWIDLSFAKVYYLAWPKGDETNTLAEVLKANNCSLRNMFLDSFWGYGRPEYIIAHSVTTELKKSSWDNQIYFHPNYPGSYILLAKDSKWTCYAINFSVANKLKLNFEHRPNQLKILVRSDFPFDKKSTKSSIKQFFKNIKTEVNFTNNNHNLDITYYPIPGQILSGNLDLFTVVWKVSQPVYIETKQIPSKYKWASIYAKRVNLLPAKGYWGDKIRVWFENFTGFDLYFQVCKLNANPKFENGSEVLDEYFFDCQSGTIYKQTYTQKNFTYWTKYEINVKLPQWLRNAHYFRVSFYKDFRWAKFFKKTDIWSFVKYSKSNPRKLYVFVDSLQWDKLGAIQGNLYVLSGDSLKKLKTFPIYNNAGVVSLTWDDDLYVLELIWKNDKTFSTITSYGRYRYSSPNNRISDYQNPNFINWYDINQSSRYWNANFVRIYGYTDRGLYKPGDTIFFAWWVRNLKNKAQIPTGSVVVSLKLYGEEIQKFTVKHLDNFGGFKWKFKLSKSAKLGDYKVTYFYSDNVQYTHNIKVKEFQKPTFFVDEKLVKQNDKIILRVDPKYYFWENLKDYNLELNWELVWKTLSDWRDWWRNDDKYYYNLIWWNSYSSGASYTLDNLTGAKNFEIVDLSKLKNLSYKYTLKVTLTVKDNKTDETHIQTDYLDISPFVKVWFSGQPTERLYKSDLKNGKYIVKGHIENYDKLKDQKNINYTYYVYYRNFGYKQEKGVDGSYYYVNYTKFALVKTGLSLPNSDGDFQIGVNISKPGQYFVRYVVSSRWKILWEVQKNIYYYDWEGRTFYDGTMWDEKNNFVLDVNIPKKDYELGEKIPVNINPYKKWARIYVTVERWNDILDIYKFILSGKKIEIPVKPNYYPNINISVIQFVPEKFNKVKNQLRPSEPRFYIGYGQADISDKLVKLNITIDFPKKVYKPGEKFTFIIYTTDSKGNPVDARLSVAIVDKALADLYDLIKKPIPYFYNKLWSFIANIFPLKTLYQALRVFVSDGEKWGWGGAEAMLAIRKKFYDLAFRRGWVFTKNWKVTLTTTLPDNTTTWMIDVIWITKSVRLWTARAYFQTQKPILLQANLPTFMTIGDSLNIPVSVLSSKYKDKKITIIWAKWYYQNWKITWKSIGAYVTWVNKKVYFKVNIPKTWFDKDNLFLRFYAVVGSDSDAVEVKIPIRKKWYELSSFYFTGSKAGLYTFKIEDPAIKAILNLWLSKFPIQAFEKAFKYLVHYPYGCTEQLTSGLYPILVAIQLHNQGIPIWDIVRNWKIKISTYQDPKPIIQETINKIFQNQKEDGWLGYWPDAQESSRPILSAYVYGALKLAWKMWYEVNEEKLKKLENYLDRIWNRPLPYLYYQWIRTSLWYPINESLFEQIYKSNLHKKLVLCKPGEKCQETNLAVGVLAFAIYVNLWKTSQAMQIANQLDWNQSVNVSDRYWNFLDKDILKSVYLRGLIKLEDKVQEKYNLKKEVKKLVMDFLKNRNSEGVWGYSTQKNVQILLALWDYLHKNIISKPTTCTLKVWSKIKKVSFKTYYDLNLKFDNLHQLPVSWDCSDDVLIDQKLTYVLKDFSKIKTVLHNLTGVSWSYTGGNNVWDIVNRTGKFKVLSNASQLAVEFYIPSTQKFLANVLKMSDTLPFEILTLDRDWNICSWHLKHYEIRFDRLFLYFDHLDKNTSCTVKINTIKAFKGKAYTMPVHIFEMYKNNVWGRRVVDVK